MVVFETTESSYYCILSYLLDHGEKVDAKDSDGDLPLSIAKNDLKDNIKIMESARKKKGI